MQDRETMSRPPRPSLPRTWCKGDGSNVVVRAAKILDARCEPGWPLVLIRLELAGPQGKKRTNRRVAAGTEGSHQGN